MRCLRSQRAPSVSALVAIALVVGFSGCRDGLRLVHVTGVVSIDGQPLAGARVLFRPEHGRPSSGVTDADGRYTLQYKAGKSGAMRGKHSVSITTVADASDDAAGTSREIVPARYNEMTSLTATVDVKIGRAHV